MIAGIVQARLGSTRLPGKVVKDICGKPMLWHQIQRIKLAKHLDRIVVATTDQREDKIIADLAREAGLKAITGSVDDVLDRYYRAAKEVSASVVVRMTGDCPLIDPSVIDQVIQYYLEHQEEVDYVSLSPQWPEGFGVEVLPFAVLEQAWHEAKKLYEREHVTPYVYLSGKFRIYRLPCPQDLSHLRLTVDEPDDYEVIRQVYEELYPKQGHSFGLSDILDLFQRRPDLFEPNRHILRNNGFIKSIRAERRVLRYNPKPMLKKTDEMWRRAEPLIPASTQVRRDGLTHHLEGVGPKLLAKGKGSRVWDMDGNEYIDYSMGHGSVILGHSYPRVNEAVRKQLQQGTNFSLMHPLEGELAELLTSIIPWAEMVRFGIREYDATSGAVLAARAYTGREKIFHCGNYRWDDGCIAGLPRDTTLAWVKGELQFEFAYNDLSAVEVLFEQHKDQVAAVIIEPYQTVPPEGGFLEGLRKLAHANGALVAYDEVASGFRFRLGSIEELYGVTPDMVCFGKGLGNGMPISAFMGSREIMKYFDEDIYYSTSGVECLSLAASIATIKELQEQDVYGRTWELGSRLTEGYNWMVWDLGVAQHTMIMGLPPLTMPVFRSEGGHDPVLLKSLFQQEVLKRGILFGAAHAVSYSHSADDIDMTLAAYYEALEVIKKTLDDGDGDLTLENSRTAETLAAVPDARSTAA